MHFLERGKVVLEGEAGRHWEEASGKRKEHTHLHLFTCPGSPKWEAAGGWRGRGGWGKLWGKPFPPGPSPQRLSGSEPLSAASVPSPELSSISSLNAFPVMCQILGLVIPDPVCRPIGLAFYGMSHPLSHLHTPPRLPMQQASPLYIMFLKFARRRERGWAFTHGGQAVGRRRKGDFAGKSSFSPSSVSNVLHLSSFLQPWQFLVFLPLFSHGGGLLHTLGGTVGGLFGRSGGCLLQCGLTLDNSKEEAFCRCFEAWLCLPPSGSKLPLSHLVSSAAQPHPSLPLTPLLIPLCAL